MTIEFRVCNALRIISFKYSVIVSCSQAFQDTQQIKLVGRWKGRGKRREGVVTESDFVGSTKILTADQIEAVFVAA